MLKMNLFTEHQPWTDPFYSLNCLTKKTKRLKNNVIHESNANKAWSMKQDNVWSLVGVGVNVIVCDKSQWKYFGDKQKKKRYVMKAWYSTEKNVNAIRMISRNFKIIHSLVQRLQTGFSGKLKVLNELFIGLIWDFVRLMEKILRKCTYIHTHTF